MTLTWNGHACFTLDTDQGVVVFDPYEPYYVPGLVLPALTADQVLISHNHEDHNYVEGVKLSGKRPEITVKTVVTDHDYWDNSPYGNNYVHVVQAGDFRAAHLGDLGHLLVPHMIEQIGKLDLLMIPIGGTYTIEAVQAKMVCDQLQPRIIVPMHYRKGKLDFPKIDEPDEFLGMFEDVTVVDGWKAELTPDLHGVLYFTQPWQDVPPGTN